MSASRQWLLVVGLLGLTGGCAAQQTLRTRVVDSVTQVPLPQAQAVVELRDYSMLNSKGITYGPPIPADSNGQIVVHLRQKDAVQISAPGHKTALLGFVNGKTVKFHSPNISAGQVAPPGTVTNSRATVVIPLVPNQTK